VAKRRLFSEVNGVDMVLIIVAWSAMPDAFLEDAGSAT